MNDSDYTDYQSKTLRINLDGSIPIDNPVLNDVRTHVFSYGHRNAQGIAFSDNGYLYSSEHGDVVDDEINIIEKGKNYGWPIITYGINYSGTKITSETARDNMEQPMYYWIPSIAPSGMTFITGDKYPEWKDNLLVGSLVFMYLERMEIKDNKVVAREKLFDGIGRLRNVKQGPDGYIYMAVENEGILRIISKK